jgi:hypothetical protein
MLAPEVQQPELIVVACWKNTIRTFIPPVLAQTHPLVSLDTLIELKEK